jgi:hypothetical protein
MAFNTIQPFCQRLLEPVKGLGREVVEIGLWNLDPAARASDLDVIHSSDIDHNNRLTEFQ